MGKVRDVTNDRIIKRDAMAGYTLDADATGIYGEKQPLEVVRLFSISGFWSRKML